MCSVVGLIPFWPNATPKARNLLSELSVHILSADVGLESSTLKKQHVDYAYNSYYCKDALFI